MLYGRILVPVLFLGIGGCTNMLAARDPAAVVAADPSAVDGLNAPAAEVATAKRSTVAGPIRRESEFVRQNPRLFSKAEDERDSAGAGWQRQQQQRDKELQRMIQICNC
jgi:hypothetical protein